MKNLIEYRVKGIGFGHKGKNGVDRFNFAVIAVLDKTDLIMSKHSTEKSAKTACKKYSNDGDICYEIAIIKKF